MRLHHNLLQLSYSYIYLYMQQLMKDQEKIAGISTMGNRLTNEYKNSLPESSPQFLKKLRKNHHLKINSER